MEGEAEAKAEITKADGGRTAVGSGGGGLSRPIHPLALPSE